MDDVKRALLGDHEASKQLTEAGVLVPCCGKEPNLHHFMGLGAWAIECLVNGHIHNTTLCNSEYEARLAWNTRAPILNAEEMEMLEGLESAESVNG